jgi:hypothetical protein
VRRGPAAGLVLLASAALLFSLPLLAQQQAGPINPPPQPTPAPQPMPAPAASAKPVAESEPAGQEFRISGRTSSPIVHQPPPVPIPQIIKEFAAHEAEFKIERGNFTYTQSFVVETINDEGEVDGQYRMTSDIMFTPNGQRYQRITDAPVPTLTRISVSEQDLEDLRNIQPFVLTTEDLPQYNVTYVGQQRVDQLHTYVFDVAPKKIEKHHRYFQGRVWVDRHDLAIVKTDGKAVPDIVKGNNQNLFPRFVTYRTNLLGEFWFPTYTYGDDILHFRSGPVHIRMIVRYTNYKRYRVTVKLINPHQEPHQ